MLEELNMLSNPKSRVAEAVKTIRTNLEFSLVNGEDKKIMLTSTSPGEGKSFISAAKSIAETGTAAFVKTYSQSDIDKVKTGGITGAIANQMIKKKYGEK